MTPSNTRLKQRLLLALPLFFLLLLLFPGREHFIRSLPTKNVERKADVTKTWNAIWETVHSANPNSTTFAKVKHHSRPFDVYEVFDIFPSPVRADTIQIYDQSAYHDLIQMFSTKLDGIKICTNGGSSTAGGGHIKKMDRYIGNFDRYLRELQINAVGPITLTDRSHGTRHSLHTAVFAPNLLPPETDLLFWEFAINDYGYHIPKATRVQQERSVLLAWLREVEKMSPSPPKVILIYLWRTPFGLNFDETHMISNPVYESHAQLAKEFDFVVGHVNVASYFDELGDMLGLDGLRRLFLADKHHPNRLGHLAVSFLLLNLLRGEGKWSKGKSDDVVTGQSRQNRLEKYDWFCGNETEGKRFIQNRIVDTDTDSGWRSPLGTITLEEPRNEIVISGSKQLVVRNNHVNITWLGKRDPERIDRQGSISLACCMDNTNSAYTVVTVPKKTDPMQNVKAIFFGLGRQLSKISNLKVYIDDGNDAVSGKLIKVPHNWGCFWTWTGKYDTTWFAFDENQPEISTVTLCVENDQCKVSGMSNVMMISMAVYA